MGPCKKWWRNQSAFELPDKQGTKGRRESQGESGAQKLQLLCPLHSAGPRSAAVICRAPRALDPALLRSAYHYWQALPTSHCRRKLFMGWNSSEQHKVEDHVYLFTFSSFWPSSSLLPPANVSFQKMNNNNNKKEWENKEVKLRGF